MITCTNLEIGWVAVGISLVDFVVMVVVADTVDFASTVDVAILIVVEKSFDLSQTFPMNYLDWSNDCQVL